MDQIGASISNLIREQFPEHYREYGPLFVKFVTEYYKWLESQADSRDEWFVDKVSLVAVANKSANVVGKGTLFESQFANSNSIAISKGSETGDYDIFTVRDIIDDTHLTLTDERVPNFTHPNTRYATVSSKPNALFITRNFPELNDIDETLDQFVIYFKEKYLKGAQFRTITDTRKLIKHSLDLYRSKGTERSLDLVYKAVFGKPAHVYYPGHDLFRLSSGHWFIPRYLELSLNPVNRQLINKQIRGVLSGATAFVEEIIRRNMETRIVEIAYISAISGIFISGEKVTLVDTSLDITQAPTIVGSLNEIEVDVSGAGMGFAQNDVVEITSVTGRAAQGKVMDVSNTVGKLSYSLIDGGYGYIGGANTEAYISESILRVENATFDSDFFDNEYVSFLNTITQPLAILHYENANGDFEIGDHIFTWVAGVQHGQGEVLTLETDTQSSGRMWVSVTSGDLEETAIYTTANAVAANLNITDGYTDMTVNAQVIGNYANVTVKLTGYSDTLALGEIVTQPATKAEGTVSGVLFDPSNTVCTVSIINSEGIFKNGFAVQGQTSGATGTVSKTNFDVGVVNSTSDFYNYTNNFVYSNSMTGGTITSISVGSGSEVTFSNDIIYSEDISINTDLISNHLSEVLSGTWNFPANNAANLSSIISQTLTVAGVTIGKIQSILSTNPGTDYNKIPIVRLYEPDIYVYRKPDTVALTVTNSAGFVNGEIITQASTNARGRIKAISSGQIRVQNLRFYSNNDFVVTTVPASKVVGTQTGFSTDITSVELKTQSPRFGDDVSLTATLVEGVGAITSIKVIDSGFGFSNGEVVTLTKDENAAVGFAILKTHGTGTGYYKSRDGFLSDNKKLSDGYYWQEYSYEVRSSVIDDFKKTLKGVIHVAGTKYFDALYYDTINSETLHSETYLINVFAGELRLRDGTSFLLLRNGTDKLTLGYEHIQ